jgi:hypothetical protein
MTRASFASGLTRATVSDLSWPITLVMALAHLILVWVMPVLPAQDLPQHLAYARIIRDHGQADLPFSEYYRLPERFQPYFAAHYAMAALGRIVGIEAAGRLLFSIYVVAILFAFGFLMKTVHGREHGGPGRAVLLGSLVVWNPVACMGFLEFLLTIPFLIMGVALSLRYSEATAASYRDGALVVGTSLILVSLHMVAAGCFVLFAIIHALVNPSWKRLDVAVMAVAGSLAAFGGWALGGGAGVGSLSGVDWSEAQRRAHGLEFINDVFKIDWHDPAQKLNYLAWTVLGPFRPGPLVAVAVILGLAVWTILRARAGRPRRPAGQPNPYRRTCLAFSVASWLCPWGFYVPSEITFLDLRLMTVAFALALACIPPQMFEPARARLALIATCSVLTLHFGFRAISFGAEAKVALRVLEKAAPGQTMTSLTFHNRSDHFAKQFRLTHFLPMYYTVRSGGINGQFWAKYTHHLPVDYLPGKRLKGPPDWRPWEVTKSHLSAVDYVVVQLATAEDSRQNRAAGESVVKGMTPIVCEGLWCLYRGNR